MSSNWVVGNYVQMSEILLWAGFDHFPTSLNIEAQNSPHKWIASFKFESMWFRHNEFLPLLKTWWMQALYDLVSIMYRFCKKT